MVSAILLKQLGFSDSVIIEDYMKTKDNLLDFLKAFAAEHPEVNIHTILPREENIKRFWLPFPKSRKKGGLLMNGTEVRTCETHGSQERLKQAWIDRDGKLISFHSIDSGQVMEAEETTFWKKIVSLTYIGYRIQ